MLRTRRAVVLGKKLYFRYENAALLFYFEQWHTLLVHTRITEGNHSKEIVGTLSA